MLRDGMFLDTLERRGDGHGFYSSFGSDRFYVHHHYHPYRRSDKKYFPYEFKISMPII